MKYFYTDYINNLKKLRTQCEIPITDFDREYIGRLNNCKRSFKSKIVTKKRIEEIIQNTNIVSYCESIIQANLVASNLIKNRW